MSCFYTLITKYTIFNSFCYCYSVCYIFCGSHDGKIRGCKVLPVARDDDFCFHHCKIHEDVYSSFDDPDDAWRELDDGGYCIGCPMAQAMDIIDEAVLAKWKKRQKKKEGKS